MGACSCIVCLGPDSLFSRQRRIKLVGGVCTDWAGASLHHYTLQQSGRLPNKQMKSTERCFLESSEMWLQQMQCWHQQLTQCDNLLCLHSQLHFDLFWKKRGEGVGGWHYAHDHTQDNVCQQQQRCHYVRETKTDNRGWFHGAVMLLVQFQKDFHLCWGGACSGGFALIIIHSVVNYGHYAGQNPII